MTLLNSLTVQGLEHDRFSHSIYPMPSVLRIHSSGEASALNDRNRQKRHLYFGNSNFCLLGQLAVFGAGFSGRHEAVMCLRSSSQSGGSGYGISGIALGEKE